VWSSRGQLPREALRSSGLIVVSDLGNYVSADNQRRPAISRTFDALSCGLEVACRRQRGPVDPGGKVWGCAFGDSGGVPGELLLAEDLPPLAC
jgi:hypothetical protein